MIADASLSFVGNIDLSVEQVVNSNEHDLFQPLPPEFDLAVMDRFAAYIPGWEMPKNSSEFLTGNYGFITDYLAEAFHYQFKYTNRYEEVTNRIRLGKSVEGRDEKGIKKTLCAFLKILHPDGPPTDQEFDEYVAVAIEYRRRVKEQMNKRKPDDEYARINLSYFKASGEEEVVYCPESRFATATQSPARRKLGMGMPPSRITPPTVQVAPPLVEVVVPEVLATIPVELKDEHYTIMFGDTGYSYESICSPYLHEVKTIVVEDPYIRNNHQVQNFVRFCEMAVKESSVTTIRLVTGYDDNTQLNEVVKKLDDLKQSLLELDIELDVQFDPDKHDREIRLDNGWHIKIGRGLDFYQKPESWYDIGSNDLSLRKCLETKIDIFKV